MVDGTVQEGAYVLLSEVVDIILSPPSPFALLSENNTRTANSTLEEDTSIAHMSIEPDEHHTPVKINSKSVCESPTVAQEESVRDVSPPPVESVRDMSPPPVESVKDVSPPPVESVKDVYLSLVGSVKDVSPPSVESVEKFEPTPYGECEGCEPASCVDQ